LEKAASLYPETETIVGEKPDFQAHEIKKFCELLLKGNQGIIEMLFTDKMCYVTPEWQQLIDNRDRFLSRKVVKQYIGYCQGQLKRLKNSTSLHTKSGQYNTKWAYHMIRLVTDAERIASGNAPVVWKEGDELRLLMDVRAGKFSKEDVENMANEKIERVVSIAESSELPKSGDAEFLNDWLIGVRKGIQ